MRIRAMSILAALCVAASQQLAAQSVTYVAQDRRVEAFLYEEVAYDGDAQNPVEIAVRRAAAAEGLPAFEATLLAQADDPRVSRGLSRISQVSSLRGNGIFSSGEWRCRSGTYAGYYEFETPLAATFDVTDAQAGYELFYRLDYPRPLPGWKETDLVLRRVDSSGTTLFDVEPEYLDHPVWDVSAVGILTGQLEPGRYEFRFFDRVHNDYGTLGGYEVNLRVSLVPEPATFAMMAAFAAAAAMGRRRIRA
jgi:hypothetical protein